MLSVPVTFVGCSGSNVDFEGSTSVDDGVEPMSLAVTMTVVGSGFVFLEDQLLLRHKGPGTSVSAAGRSSPVEATHPRSSGNMSGLKYPRLRSCTAPVP